ncbi:GTPases - Sulfate adenylate transferase subunit 1 [Methanosarcina barkeri 3]|uniref:GTPases-Sulfate adenylate transferase subunit 1 n=1 Tax=Methanosarcina barkeri 3 TaxID=1434107 RepID=A0A0E3SJM9_METBA|nr:C39 family peptidase [Methanosarcina barkeri]AKB80892.1 GTPases - Sulfate adenylate transferase subunit 1 [Methanosarcina barkeri 3]
MIKDKIRVGTLVLAILLVGMALIPAVSAQKEDNYSVTAEEAFKHANANVIYFIATNTPGFENWTEVSIDPKPLELYDPSGQKLYYQFSVYKNTGLIGRIDIGANKKIGHSVQLVELDSKPLNATEAMKKSIEIAKNEYPNGKIKSTQLVVYDYPAIGAMTVVKDKTTGNEYRIFVDVYTLEVIPDEPATETKRGIWSIYEQRLNNGIDKNLKNWQESDNLTKSIEQTAINKGVNINVAVTEENMKKFSGDTVTVATAIQKDLGSPTVYLQTTNYYCQPASAQMLTKYYRGTKPSQDSIYQMMGGVAPNGLNNTEALVYYKASNGLNKPNAYSSSNVTFSKAVTEINNYRPFKSGTGTHARVCRGYKQVDSEQYLRICDPSPTSLGMAYWELIGSESNRIYVGS